MRYDVGRFRCGGAARLILALEMRPIFLVMVSLALSLVAAPGWNVSRTACGAYRAVCWAARKQRPRD
jgi:hypothetical protein